MPEIDDHMEDLDDLAQGIETTGMRRYRQRMERTYGEDGWRNRESEDNMNEE